MAHSIKLREYTAADGTVAVLRKIGSDYQLKIASRETGHARWGNLREIKEDIAVFVATGRLPVSGVRVW